MMIQAVSELYGLWFINMMMQAVSELYGLYHFVPPSEQSR